MENPHRHRGEDVLSSDMQQALGDGSLCDITFAVGEGDDLVLVPGIRAVLAARCVVMRRMLYSSMREGSEDQVVMPAFSPAPFSKFIAFLHTGALVVETNDVCELMELASFFQKEDVLGLCVKFMEENCITMDMVIAVLECSETFFLHRLHQLCCEFIDENAQEVMQDPKFSRISKSVLCKLLVRDYLKVDEATLFDATLNWGRHQLADADGDAVFDSAVTDKKGGVEIDCGPFSGTQVEVKGPCDPESSPSHGLSTPPPSSSLGKLRELLMEPLSHVRFPLIPAKYLTSAVKRSGVVSQETIMSALAYQTPDVVRCDTFLPEHYRPRGQPALEVPFNVDVGSLLWGPAFQAEAGGKPDEHLDGGVEEEGGSGEGERGGVGEGADEGTPLGLGDASQPVTTTWFGNNFMSNLWGGRGAETGGMGVSGVFPIVGGGGARSAGRATASGPEGHGAPASDSMRGEQPPPPAPESSQPPISSPPSASQYRLNSQGVVVVQGESDSSNPLRAQLKSYFRIPARPGSHLNPGSGGASEALAAAAAPGVGSPPHAAGGGARAFMKTPNGTNAVIVGSHIYSQEEWVSVLRRGKTLAVDALDDWYTKHPDGK